MIKKVAELRGHPLNDKVYGSSDILSDDFLTSVSKLGVLQPLLITNDDVIISGHQRWAAAKRLEIDSVPVVVSDVTDDLEIEILVIESNKQRDKTFSQKMREAEELKRIEKILAGGRQAHGMTAPGKTLPQNFVEVFDKGETIDKVAKKIGIGSGEQFRKANKVWKAAQAGNDVAKQYVDKLDKNETTIYAAEMAVRREEIKEKAESVAIPTGKKYRVLYVDPPWKYSNEMPEYFYEQADHYILLIPKEVEALAPQIKELCEDNAVLFLWSTSPVLPEALDVVKAWGFTYKSSFVWDKIKHNMGHYNSVGHEFLLVCVKGSCMPDVKKLYDSVVSVERSSHSEKPEVFREIIDTIYPNGNRIELFARKEVEGW